ncbi:MAG: polyprenyl diphosphate synthase [Clostridia bacterium]|nr:polyprenyl diphosphate synthase [Clostridia bacterium]
MGLFRKKRKAEVLPEKINGLTHIAFIMDGNGRWAKKRGLPRESGHVEGAKNFETIATHCLSLGISHITVYAFSTENWSRPPHEVDAIMQLLSRYLDMAKEKFEKYNTRLVFLGDKSPLPPELRQKTEEWEKSTAGRPNVLNIALNYGSRDEIVHAVNALMAEGKTSVTKEDISGKLYTSLSPDPDLVVRTGGDYRVSNFLLWQSAYAEYYFTKTLWPDLSCEEVDAAIADFCGRERRYGGVKS